MTIKVAINGFGRIGRLVTRIIEEKRLNGEDIAVVAINDSCGSKDYLSYLLKYDSVHGKFEFNYSIFENFIIVNGNKILTFANRDPEQINWGLANVDIVIDCTGAFTNIESAKKHLQNGVKKVIVSAPSTDIPMYVIGVNHYEYSGEPIISNASCTTNCIAPLAKIINDEFGIEEGLMTTIHATTASQNTVDGKSKKRWRDGRSASNNIIPAYTGAAKAVGEIIPDIKGKLTGMAFRVPVSNVSVVDFTVKLKRKTCYSEIVSVIKKYSEGEMNGIIGYTNEELVSSDFIGDSRSTIFDINAGIALNDNFVKLVAWYDNEWGYSYRVVDLILHVFS